MNYIPQIYLITMSNIVNYMKSHIHHGACLLYLYGTIIQEYCTSFMEIFLVLHHSTKILVLFLIIFYQVRCFDIIVR